jgi:hypothetical protein
MRRQSCATHRYCSALVVTAVARRNRNNALADLEFKRIPISDSGLILRTSLRALTDKPSRIAG